MIHVEKVIVRLIMILSVMFVLSYGCHPFQSSLPGVYVSNEQDVKDSIFLYKNFRYVHKALLGDSLKMQKGRWDYSYGTIKLYDFNLYVADQALDSILRIAEVNISYKGIIKIEDNPESDINYVKVR